MVRKLREGKEMPYVLWVLNGDTRQWEMYKGVNDAKQFIRDNDYDEFLDELNTQVFPNGTYYNNYIDWIVIPAGEEPRKFDTHKFYNSLKYESMKRNRYRGLDTVDESIGESYRANRIGLKENSNSALDNIQMYIDNINVRFPCKDGDLDIWDNGDGTYKIVIMDDRGRVVKDVTQSKRPNSLVIDIKGVYDILKLWN